MIVYQGFKGVEITANAARVGGLICADAGTISACAEDARDRDGINTVTPVVGSMQCWFIWS